MIRGRVQRDGSIIFPARGQPPEETEDYKRDPGNQYKLIPVLLDCEFRFQGKRVLECCPNDPIVFYVCRKGLEPGPVQCRNCIKSGRRDQFR